MITSKTVVASIHFVISQLYNVSSDYIACQRAVKIYEMLLNLNPKETFVILHTIPVHKKLMYYCGTGTS